MWFYVHCTKATDALGGTAKCWVLTQHHFEFSRFKERLCTSCGSLTYPGPFFKDIIFLMSFNSAHGGGVLLLAFFCWLHCFLTVLAAVAGLFSTPFLSFSFPVDSWAQQTHVCNRTHAEPLGGKNPGALWWGNREKLGHSQQGESVGCGGSFPLLLEGLLWNRQHCRGKARETKLLRLFDFNPVFWLWKLFSSCRWWSSLENIAWQDRNRSDFNPWHLGPRAR